MPSDASVTISGDSGTLTANAYRGAGIGGGYNEAAGTITISGGVVTANGGICGAGIGGGGNGAGGTINISGGTVTAMGGKPRMGCGSGAGIGGGGNGTGGTINISGGTVIATGCDLFSSVCKGGAGIGGGGNGVGESLNISGGTINISGGTIIATGGTLASGIGGGGKSSSGAVLKISQAATVIAASDGTRNAIDAVDGVSAVGEDETVAGIIQANFESKLAKETEVEILNDHCQSLNTSLSYITHNSLVYMKSIAFTSPEITKDNVYTLFVTPNGETGKFQQNGTDDSATLKFPVANGGINSYGNVKPSDKWPLIVDTELSEYNEGASVTRTAADAPNGKVFAGWTAGGIILSNPENQEITFTMPANVVELTPTYVDKTYTISSAVSSLDFSYNAGNTSIQPKQVTITNTGNTEVTCACNALTAFTVTGPQDGNTIAPDASKTWTVVPKAGLAAGTYNETLTVSTDHSTNVAVSLNAVVNEVLKVSVSLNPKLTATANSATVTWAKIAGADGYYIYGAPCGKDMKKLKSIKSANVTKWTQKNLKNGKNYKYVIKAYKKSGKKVKIINTSMSVHVATPGSKSTNAKKVTANFSSATLKAGKAKQIKAKIVKQNSKKPLVNHVSKFRYKTNNKNVATVSKGGKIKAVGKGKCSIYVYANNGVYKKIAVTVK